MAFDVGPSSFGDVNICPDPGVIINEVNIETDADVDLRFIELRSKWPHFPINNFKLVSIK